MSGLVLFPWKSSPAVKQGFFIPLGEVAKQRYLNQWGLVTISLSLWKGQRMCDVQQGHGSQALLLLTHKSFAHLDKEEQ